MASTGLTALVPAPINRGSMTAPEIFGVLSASQSAEILNWLANHDRPAYRNCASMLATRRKLRPVFVERKPRDEKNQWMQDALTRPANADLALEILQVWTLGNNLAMVAEFLDALAISHDGKGLIDQIPSEPPAEKVQSAVEALLANHGVFQVFVYLHLFAGMDEEGWLTLKGLLATHPALAPVTLAKAA